MTGCYNFLEPAEKADWHQAKALCEQIKGHLVEINTKEETQEIYKILDRKSEDSFWLGLRNESLVNGVGDIHLLSGGPATYFNWNDKDDVQKLDGQHCALVWDNKYWYIDTCMGYNWGTKNVLCELDEPFYRFIEGPLTWSQAKAECEKSGWQIVEIDSLEESEAVLIEMKKRTKIDKIWIGLSFTGKSGSWEWESGNPYTYASWQWAPNKPDNVGNNQDCAIMNAMGKWDDFVCGETLSAICEKQQPSYMQGM